MFVSLPEGAKSPVTRWSIKKLSNSLTVQEIPSAHGAGLFVTLALRLSMPDTDPGREATALRPRVPRRLPVLDRKRCGGNVVFVNILFISFIENNNNLFLHNLL